MTLLSVFVQRPVASVLLGIAIVLLGILAYLRLPVAALPQAQRVLKPVPSVSLSTLSGPVIDPTKVAVGRWPNQHLDAAHIATVVG